MQKSNFSSFESPHSFSDTERSSICLIIDIISIHSGMYWQLFSIEKFVGLIKHTEIEERGFKSTVINVKAVCLFIFGRSLRKIRVCMCRNTKRLFWNLLSKMGLLNNHPYTTLNIFFFSK